MAQEYKLYVADPRDSEAMGAAEHGVCQHLSACASPTEDPDEFYREVLLHEHPSRDGGVYICGTLDRDPCADYLTAEVPKSEYEFNAAGDIADKEAS